MGFLKKLFSGKDKTAGSEIAFPLWLKQGMYTTNLQHNEGYLRSDLDGTFMRKPANIEQEQVSLKQLPQDIMVYTTNSAGTKKEAITYFILDEDGDFQAFGKETPGPKNAMLASLRQILELEKTILDLPPIKRGETYIKNGASWVLF